VELESFLRAFFLPDALSCDAEVIANFIQRLLLSVCDTEALT
jgi:hypothetical protein